MRNIALKLAYDGSRFVGWQVQPSGDSVQSTVEEAIFQLTGERTRLRSAGRTDAGVHALGQVANFTTGCEIPLAGIRAGLQHHLPDEILVREAYEVAADFHATYSAVQKRYRYVIHNTQLRWPFLRQYVYRHPKPLDARAMHEAAQVLVGKHDFRSFESHFPNKATSVRTVSEVTVARYPGWPIWFAAGPIVEFNAVAPADSPGEFICLDIVADGFLYNMVRAITGTLLKVGSGQWSDDDVRRILIEGDRAQAGATAPASGLYLVQVDYPPELMSPHTTEATDPA